MASDVEQLREDATNNEVPVSDLLRRAKVIATKLHQDEFNAWIDKELNGYSPKENVPEYRVLKGEPQGFNPFRGWIPLAFEEPETQNLISQRGASQPIRELEELTKGQDALAMKWPPELEVTIRKSISMQTDVRLLISRTAVVGIVDAVRNKLLEWCLKLEAAGIRGDDAKFSATEVTQAKTVEKGMEIHNIENFHGNIGDYNQQWELGKIVPQESFWNKFLWYVVIALIVLVIGNVISGVVLKKLGM